MKLNGTAYKCRRDKTSIKGSTATKALGLKVKVLKKDELRAAKWTERVFVSFAVCSILCVLLYVNYCVRCVIVKYICK